MSCRKKAEILGMRAQEATGLGATGCAAPRWMTPWDAYYLACERGPSDDTRKAACRDPLWALRYAQEVDRAPHDLTRKGACQHPWYAYGYAPDVDRAPRDDTRRAACRSPKFALQYARDVDKAPHADTREAVRKLLGGGIRPDGGA